MKDKSPKDSSMGKDNSFTLMVMCTKGCLKKTNAMALGFASLERLVLFIKANGVMTSLLVMDCCLVCRMR